MMSIARGTISNFRKAVGAYAHGRPLARVEMGPLTLDSDDVKLARYWLGHKDLWGDDGFVKRYEEAFALWNQSKHAYAFASGRVALSSIIYALDLQPGDEVIMPGYTCVVVANAFHFAGIRIVYADIELDTYGIDISSLADRIGPKTRAILLHHLYGLVCRDYSAIIDLARTHGLKVIEDCAQSAGARYGGLCVGNRGDAAFYSSEQSKVYSTIQGGIAVTNQDDLGSRIRDFRDRAPYPDDAWTNKLLYNVILSYYGFKHRQRWWLRDVVNALYGRNRLISTTNEEERGLQPDRYGWKMVGPVASIGLNQLRKVDSYISIRRKHAESWDRWCDANGYRRPMVIKDSAPVFLRYPVLAEPEKKSNPSWAESELNIELGLWFVGNLHPTSQKIDQCPQSAVAVRQCVNFPTLFGEHVH
jgi:perosamine synthetase